MLEEKDLFEVGEVASEQQTPMLGQSQAELPQAKDSSASVPSTLDKNVAKIKEVRDKVLTLTCEDDWIITSSTSGNKKLYLQSSGAEKIARFFGIAWDKPEIEQFVDRGYPAFLVKGYIYSDLIGVKIYHEGGRSGKEPFFSQTKDSKGNPIRRSPEEINILNLRKAALSNWLGTGICRLLGLRGISLDTLAKSGLKIQKIKEIVR